MLKISTDIDIDSDLTTFVLEGRLAGPWVDELQRCWEATPGKNRKRRRVDLTGVTYVDADGKAALARMHEEGAELIAAGCLTRCIVEEIAGRSGDPMSERQPETEDRA